MVKGDIWLARFPYGGKIGAKLRPVLLLTGPIGPVPELLTAYITSQIPTVLLPSDLLLDPHAGAFTSTNLARLSVVRLHKLASIHQSDNVRRLGVIPQTAWIEVETRLRAFLSL